MAFNENFVKSSAKDEMRRSQESAQDINESENENVNSGNNGQQRLNIRRKPATQDTTNNSGSFRSEKATSSNEPETHMTPVKLTPNGLDARLERLIDIVADYLKKTPEEIKRIKENALKNPVGIQNEYMNIYSKQIAPLRQSRHTSIESAKKENPDKVVFLYVNGERSVLKCLDKEKAGANIIYDGLIVETVGYARTPFLPANELFKEEPKLEVIAEEASNEAFSQPSKMKI